jgi:hypothetical protein
MEPEFEATAVIQVADSDVSEVVLKLVPVQK